jgi:hypothetical protein|tara:strand:+ start:27452 stop:29083 length:1632 start_codon:yes stop_codon:yes gene_type:complete
MGVTATVAVVARLGGWLVGIEGSGEVGETTVVGGTLTDVTADTRAAVQPINVEYGISGSGPLDRIAGTGIMTFALDNSAGNSHSQQGAYSPGHANAVTGWDLGAEVLLKITYDGTTYYKFSGTLIDISPEAGQYGHQSVTCKAVDWMDDAVRAKVRNVSIQSDKRADELIGTMVTSAVSKQPNATSYSTGQSTFATAFDNLQDAQTSVYQALADATISELGFLYIIGDTVQGGTLRFEDRHARPKKGAASATFNNTMGSLSVTRTRGMLINRVYVVVHPRTTDGSATVLYELTTTNENPLIPAGESILINCPFKEPTINAYRVAAESLVTPVSGTDWVANAAADGSGTNLTSSVTVSIENSAANSAELKLVNAHATSTAYVTTLQLRGTAVRDVTETVLSASDTPSQFVYGEIDSRVDMKYESKAGEFGSEIAKWLLNTYKDPKYSIQEFRLLSNKSDYAMTHSLAREPGDKITFSEAVTGISATGASGAEIGYFINGVKMTINAPGIIETSWILSPAESQAAWILNQVGASEMGVSTNLGFA